MNVRIKMEAVPKLVRIMKDLLYALVTLVIGLMEMEGHAQVNI